MKVNDFLIKIETGEVFQISKINNESTEFIKLGDTERLTDEINSRDYLCIPLFSDEGKNIMNVRREAKEKFVYYDINTGEVKSDSSFVINESSLEELKNSLVSMRNKTSFSQGEIIKTRIRSFRGESIPHKNVIQKGKIAEQRESLERRSQKPSEDSSDSDLKFRILEPNVEDSLDKVIMNKVTKDKIDTAINKSKYGSLMSKYIGGQTIKSTEGALILNFYGPPGTGKTITAKAFANKLNKKILMVDFAQLISKMVGDTGKNIQTYFDKARDEDLILFFDEADTLIQKRSSGGDTQAYYVNQNQNIFMRELDKFKGIVILTTNLFENYDPALLRRISNIPFPLPTPEAREHLIKLHLPTVKLAHEVNPFNLAEKTEGFSGGDIKNLCHEATMKFFNEIINSNTDKSKDEIDKIFSSTVLGMGYFLDEIDYIIKNKSDYDKDIEFSRKSIGLVA